MFLVFTHQQMKKRIDKKIQNNDRYTKRQIQELKRAVKKKKKKKNVYMYKNNV
jgi:hypothetical protein